MYQQRNENYNKTIKQRSEQFEKSVTQKGTAIQNLNRAGLIRQHQKEGDYIFDKEQIEKNRSLKQAVDQGFKNRKIKDNQSYKDLKAKLVEEKSSKRESIKEQIKNKKEIFQVNLSIKDMQDKIEVIHDNTLKAEKCLELDKQEFETAKRLWTQYLESLDRKLQELVKMTDTEFKSKEKYLKELNKLKEKHKDLDREVEKQKLEYEERKQAFDFLFNMSSDEFKENFEKNRQIRRTFINNRETLIELLTWELNEYENTSVRVDNLTADEKERIKDNIGQSSTFVTELEIEYIDQDTYDQTRKSKFDKK